ncbi:MAG: lamin tail domain-containing protein [Myxococcus sp.]|nr:lamin tail domain-containing protein [Myxococcus sp.]
MRTLTVALVALALPALAYPVTVDGVGTDWSTRVPPAGNSGLVVRNAASQGEWVFVDAPGDQRTDAPSTTEQDIQQVRITGDATNLYVLVRTGAQSMLQTPQLQLSIDLDRVASSGQSFLAGFADTIVVPEAQWEFLVQTRFAAGSGPGAQVLNTAFAQVATATAVRGVDGVELSVPWAALGLTAPPRVMRITLSSYISGNLADDTVDLGGPGISNAFDSIGDCGDPRVSGYTNAFACDLSDGDLDWRADIWFQPDGEVYAPLSVNRFVPAPAVSANEWIAVTNVSPVAQSLAGFKLGDEETIDGSEGMSQFPVGATVAAGATYVVATNGAQYNTRFGVLPDAEYAGATAAPDMTAFASWATGSVALANAGDEVVLLDPSNVLLDVAVYGTGAYPGVTSFTPAPGSEVVLARTSTTRDTDNCLTDFALRGASCVDSSGCGGSAACNTCLINTCAPTAAGSSCTDGDVCNGAETCNGSGACQAGTALVCSDADACNGVETCNAMSGCVAGTPLVCDDSNVCTNDTCAAATGCQFAPVAAGASCTDGNACNGAEVCSGAGACLPGLALNCDDSNPCTADSCSPMTGCTHTPVMAGVTCAGADLCNSAALCDGAGACQPGTPVVCNDGNPCTNDRCEPSLGCIAPPAATGTSCSDGNQCNGVEACNGSGACQTGTPLNCNDSNPCTSDSCAPATGCSNAPLAAGTSCADSNACNGLELCSAAGVCQAGTPLDCNDSNACTADACNMATGCENLPEPVGTSCLDANRCNGAEACNGAGVCQAGTPLDCNDNQACTSDSCAPATGCLNAPVAAGTSCADNDACNGAEACNAAGLCVPGTPLACNDSNPCTVDSCSATTGCVTTPAAAGTSCADGTRCNGAETCDAMGVCQPGTPVSCPASTTPCFANVCSPLSGACDLVAQAAGTSCSDGVFCNGEETCDGVGRCVPGAPPDAGVCFPDGGVDGGPDPMDAGLADAGLDDAGIVDAGESDAGEPDAGEPDAGEPDAGAEDAGERDAGSMHADAGSMNDAGAPDAGGPVAMDAGLMGADAGDGVTLGGGGCGCSSSSGAELSLLMLALAAWRRRSSARAVSTR